MTNNEYARKWNEEYKQYNKVFSKYGLHIPEMANMQTEIDKGRYKIIIITEKYHRTATGRWQTKPYETETKEINVDHYMNVIAAIPLFKDRVVKSYTSYGYIPVELTCISWGTMDTKIKRIFKFEKL